MDELFTKIWNDEPVRWRIFFVMLNALFSSFCALVTQNIIVTIIFVCGTALIDILVEICNYLDLENTIDQIFAIEWYKRYLFFIFIASLPAICGILLKEIDISERLTEKLFANLVPNILGALVVCSIMDHISKFDYKQVVCSLIRSKKDFLNIFMRIAYLGCFLNAVSYKMNDERKWTNIVNSVYIFIIVYCGAIVLTSFVLRVIDKEYFYRTAKEIYPAKTLFFGGLYLISCGASPILFGIEKHEPILLTINSVTAGAIAIFLFVFVARRTENKSNTYPFMTIFGFIAFLCLNCGINFYKWDKTGNISQQLISGIVIFIFVLALLLWANKMQKIKGME